MSGPALWVLRHGESTWNAAGRMQRQIAHPPLTQLGFAQAHAAGEALRDNRLDRIVTSDAVRALQTAEVLAAMLDVPISVDERLRERGWTAPGVLEDATDRVVSALRDVAVSGDRVAVVTHGDIVCLIGERCGAGDGWPSGSDVPNGAVVQVNLDGLLRR